MSKSTITTFIDQVKHETTKIIWPSKKETITSTITVVVMVLICSVFFLLNDYLINKIISFLLKVGS